MSLGVGLYNSMAPSLPVLLSYNSEMYISGFPHIGVSTLNGVVTEAGHVPVFITMFPVVVVIGTSAVSVLSETMLNVVETPSNVTAVTALKPLPIKVTCVFSGPDAGEKLVTVAPVQFGTTRPYSAKSSILKFPTPEFIRLITTVIRPVNPLTGLLTAVCPVAPPGTVAVSPPTAMPLMVIFQLAGPVGLFLVQMSKWVMSAIKPEATSIVNVMLELPA
jgi:hypothetical protein